MNFGNKTHKNLFKLIEEVPENRIKNKEHERSLHENIHIRCGENGKVVC